MEGGICLALSCRFPRLRFEMPISSAAMHHCHEREITTMSIYKSDDESIPRDTEAHYEAVASQEKHIWRR